MNLDESGEYLGGSPKQSGRPQVWTSVCLTASVCQSGSLAVVVRGIDGIVLQLFPYYTLQIFLSQELEKYQDVQL